jgi:glycerol-3-phosphate O-acyltransferase
VILTPAIGRPARRRAAMSRVVSLTTPVSSGRAASPGRRRVKYATSARVWIVERQRARTDVRGQATGEAISKRVHEVALADREIQAAVAGPVREHDSSRTDAQERALDVELHAAGESSGSSDERYIRTARGEAHRSTERRAMHNRRRNDPNPRPL